MGSTIICAVGQAGNQLALPIWDLLSRDNGGRTEAFFSRFGAGPARCVLVDSEPKVVGSVGRQLHGILRQENLVNVQARPSRRPIIRCLLFEPSGALQSGCGNNWAVGYCDMGPLVERAMDRLRAEMEVRGADPSATSTILGEGFCLRTQRCDVYNGCVLLHSIAGGTGSGCGSALLEQLRDLSPKSYITTISIGPRNCPICAGTDSNLPLDSLTSEPGLAHV
jgi:hypothetical protein